MDYIWYLQGIGQGRELRAEEREEVSKFEEKPNSLPAELPHLCSLRISV